jgi:hypothetical protein
MAGVGNTIWTAPLKTGRSEDKKIMKKNSTQYYFTSIILIHILVYFFKIDRDVFALQEYSHQPNPTYTDQPHPKYDSYFGNPISDALQFSESFNVKNDCIESIAIWNALLLSYNSRVQHLLKANLSYFAPTIRSISVLYRHKFLHKSSEDEDLEYRFFA